MLRKIRLTLAIICFTLITLLFLDFTGTLHAWFGWMAKVQLLPAVLAVNAGVVAALVLLTLLFGRVYCSVICPLGVFQDVVSRAAARRRKNRFRYSRALSWLRYGILVLFLVALAAHFKPVSNLLAPYSAYGRIVSNLFAPLYLWGNNLLAYLAERAGSYAFYTVDVWVKGAATLAGRDVHRAGRAGMAQRPNLLQYGLPCRHDSGARVALRGFQAAHRHLEMQRLRPLCPQLQGVVHRREDAPDRLQPLRGLHAVRGRSPFRANPPLTANPMPATNPMPWNLRP